MLNPSFTSAHKHLRRAQSKLEWLTQEKDDPEIRMLDAMAHLQKPKGLLSAVNNKNVNKTN